MIPIYSKKVSLFNSTVVKKLIILKKEAHDIIIAK
jgi:hypothetical protein